MTVDNFTYEELRDLYSRYFSLGYMDEDISNKFALISLVCFVTKKAKEKDPDATPYRILKKITKDDITIPERLIWAVSIHCEDFLYNAKEIPTFGIKPNDIISTIQNLLRKYLPF